MVLYTFNHWEVNGVNVGSANPATMGPITTDVRIVAVYSGAPPPACPSAVIATAVYGNTLELNVLRGFRDNFMSRNSFGRWVARNYYRIGKYVAPAIADKRLTKEVLKGYLDLLIDTIKSLQ